MLSYQLRNWHEQIGDVNHSLAKCNLCLESYQTCDAKYQPWLEEARERKARLMALTG